MVVCVQISTILWRVGCWLVDSGFYARFIGYTLGGIYNYLLHSQSHCTTVHIQPSNHT
jgi:hypothetical protein